MPYQVFWACSLGSYGLLIKASHPRGSHTCQRAPSRRGSESQLSNRFDCKSDSALL